MANKRNKRTVKAADRAATKRFFTVAAICTIGLLVLLYVIYSLS